MIDGWAKVLDNHGQVDTFILDFEKAFDTPPHALLKSKLFSYGIGGTTLKCIKVFQKQQGSGEWCYIKLRSCCVWCPSGHFSWSLVVFLNDVSAGIESEISLFVYHCLVYFLSA